MFVNTKNIFFWATFSLLPSLALQAQDTIYYRAKAQGNTTAYNLFYKPDGGCDGVKAYTGNVENTECEAVLLDYHERADLLVTDSFSIQMDRSTGFYYKSKRGKKEVFLKKYANTISCWSAGSIVYAEFKSGSKNNVNIYIKGINKENAACSEEIVSVDIEVSEAIANGRQNPALVREVAAGVKVAQEKKVIKLNIPEKAFPTFSNMKFELYKGNKMVKDHNYIVATETIIYIANLPKGKYTYKLWLGDEEVLKQGDITLK